MKSLCQLRTKPKRIRSRDTCEYEQYALSWIVTTTTTTTTTATIKWHLVNFNWINVIVVACLLSCKCMFTYWLMCSRSCAYAPSPPLPSVMLLLSFSCWLSFSFLLSSPGRFIFNCNLSSARKHRNFSEWIYCQIIQNIHFTIWYSVVLIKIQVQLRLYAFNMRMRLHAIKNMVTICLQKNWGSYTRDQLRCARIFAQVQHSITFLRFILPLVMLSHHNLCGDFDDSMVLNANISKNWAQFGTHKKQPKMLCIHWVNAERWKKRVQKRCTWSARGKKYIYIEMRFWLQLLHYKHTYQCNDICTGRIKPNYEMQYISFRNSQSNRFSLSVCTTFDHFWLNRVVNCGKKVSFRNRELGLKKINAICPFSRASQRRNDCMNPFHNARLWSI